MKTVTIGICKEPGTFRAYCAHDGNNIAIAKSTSRAEALVQLFDYLSEEYSASFYDDGRIEIPEENQCTKNL